MMQTLSKLKENEEGIISKIDAKMFFKFQRRFFEFGLLDGTRVKVLKISMLKKTILINFNGITLSVQKEFADLIYMR